MLRALNIVNCGLYLRAASNAFGDFKKRLRLQFKGVFNSRAASNDDFTVFIIKFVVNNVCNDFQVHCLL